MLSAEGIVAAYGGKVALHSVSLSIGAGEIVALVGANGAGKSTMLKSIHGLLTEVAGTIKIGGTDISAYSTERRVDAGLAYVPEGRQVFGRLTVDENLEIAFRRRSTHQRSDLKAEIFARFPRLCERQGQMAGTLSGGEQQMLAIGRALMARPKVLMLDEPTLGLAPLIIREVAVLLNSLRESGIAIVLAEQNVRIALAVADRGYVVQNGMIVAEGGARDLQASEVIRKSYLGG